MNSTLHTPDSQTFDKHHDNIMAILARRIEVAQAANDSQLIELLEQERQQIGQATNSDRNARSFAAKFAAFKQDVVNTFFGGSELQVSQYKQGSDDWWYAFDPQTGNCVYADSEAELRLWIEENYQGK